MSTHPVHRRSFLPGALVVLAVVAAVALGLVPAASATPVAGGGASAGAAPTTVLPGIAGTVTDGTTGLATIDVRVYDATTALFVAKTTTSASGTYRVAVAAGSYKVRFSDPTGTWRLEWFDGAPTLAGATPVVVAATGTATADAVLEHPLTLLAGRTVTATDRIIPLSGMSVRVYDASTSLLAAKAVSGPGGSYAVGDLPPGRYLVRVSDPAGTYGLTWYPAAATVLGAVPVVVGVGAPARADVLLWPTADVSGTVSGPSGPLAGIAVRLYDANTRALVAKTVTGADGTYAFVSLHMGSYGRGAYRVRFSDPSGTYALQWFSGQSTESTATVVTVDVREVGSAVADAQLVTTGGLAGHVSDGATGLPGISVRVYSTSGARVTEVTTGPAGNWSAPALPAGTYKVGFGDDSGHYLPILFASAPTFALATPVTVAAGSVTDIGDQALAPATPLAMVVDTADDARDAVPGDRTCDDGSGRCPLRAAIDESNADPAADTVTIEPGIDPVLSLAGAAEDANATGDLDSRGDLTVHGNGATVDAGGLDRAVQHIGRLRIDELTLTGGTTEADVLTGRGDDGGALLAFGDVTLTDTTVTGNVAVRHSSGRGGGVAVVGNLTMVRGTVTDNVAENLGGGVWAIGANTVITDSTIDGNRTSIVDRDAGGNGSASALDIGSNEALAGVATITGTTVSNNISTLCCGSQSGGGITLAVTTATIVRSTVVGNQANMFPWGFPTIGGGAGISGFGGHVAVVASTVAGNTGYEGIYQLLPMGGVGPFTVQGSVVAGALPVCNGAWISLGWNVLTDASCQVPYANPTDRVVADPLLGPLTANGGPTWTRLPLVGSAALDAVPIGTPGLCDGTVATDQRGIARPQGSACDVGAVERAP